MKNAPLLWQETLAADLQPVQLVATDMDGTLTADGKFSPILLRSLIELAAAGITTLVVTGRSAGWVQCVVAYLPVAGAIAENGGVFLPTATGLPRLLDPALGEPDHRHQLAATFQAIQAIFPDLTPSADNAFRITDWTFDIGNLGMAELAQIEQICADHQHGFTYSTVQCHIRPLQQNKGEALHQILEAHFAYLARHEVVTVGDSPNDESLFDDSLFPLSVGVANIQHYCDRLTHMPKYIAPAAEVYGFQALATALLHATASV